MHFKFPYDFIEFVYSKFMIDEKLYLKKLSIESIKNNCIECKEEYCKEFILLLRENNINPSQYYDISKERTNNLTYVDICTRLIYNILNARRMAIKKYFS